MTEPPEESIRTHHLSAQLLLRIKEGHVYHTGFTDAAFMVVLRSEIYVANLTQRPVGNLVDHCNIDTTLQPATEAMWARRAIAHAAAATNIAYARSNSLAGPAQDPGPCHQQEELELMLEYINKWEHLSPQSFRPIYTRDRISATNPFPCFWYANDYHAAAWQYLELARVLLLASSAQSYLARIRQGRILGRSNDEAIRDGVRVICGVALSNPQFVQAGVGAGLVIAVFGELFDDPVETGVLFELLSDAEAHLGWPCLKAKEYLKGVWCL